MSDTILELDGLTKNFGGIVAVDDVSFEVERERIMGLIGPNGAGKTTLLNLLSGFYNLDEGQIFLDGDRIDQLRPYQRSRHGLVRTFQHTRELTGLTVYENLLLAATGRRTEQVLPQFLGRSSLKEAEERKSEHAAEILEQFELTQHRDEYAGNLSGGQQKLLELGRALMAEPNIVLLDEPMAGVNPALEDQILDVIERLRNDGCTFIIIEHDMEMIMSISDEIVALHNGQVLARGTPAAVRDDEALLEAYLGGEV